MSSRALSEEFANIEPGDGSGSSGEAHHKQQHHNDAGDIDLNVLFAFHSLSSLTCNFMKSVINAVVIAMPPKPVS